MKILQIEAINFKLFTRKFQLMNGLEKADLVLLNGPNGYGKTSVFDIIEFCLTGEISRINNYTQDLAIGKNEIGESKILISDETKPAYVKLVLEEFNKIIDIRYLYSPENGKRKASKENNPHKIFQSFNRQIFCNNKEIHNQTEFLKNLQLEGVGEWFDKCCFLSQDEHLQFLKEAKRSKAQAISFLFDIPKKWEKEKEKIKNILDILNNRRRKNHIAYIVRLEEKEKELDNKIRNLKVKITSDEVINNKNYYCLFKEKNIFWDKKEIHFNKEEYEKAIQEIQELLYFSEHMDECKNYLFNLPYKEYEKEFDGGEEISYEEYPLEYAYRFYSLIVHERELEQEYTKNKKGKILLECIQKKEYQNINWKFVREEELLTEIEIAEIQGQLGIVKNLENAQGILEKTMVSLKKTRDDLMKYTKDAIQYNGIEDTFCPLCGAPYKNWEELENRIKNETNVLNNISNDSVNQTLAIKNKLYKDFFFGIEEKIKKNQQIMVSEKTYKKLQEVKKYKLQIIKVQKELQEIDIFLPDTFQDSITEINEGYNNLLSCLQEKLKIIPEEVKLQLDSKNFSKKYEQYYDNKEKNFFEKTANVFRDKMEYIKFLYYNSTMQSLDESKKELQKIVERKKQLNKIIEQLQEYQNAINEGIQEYKKKIIKDIEPLLHVYTAKILQQKFNGKSIFIYTDDKIENIQLVNSIKDKQDILYSMSSGQLSAVALAFLLCMNQVYSRYRPCSILLIDDPVQTIDDVNMVGFVDILRYEFTNRQIFISTHEQKFEWFLRYRYAKAGKEVKLFNMKNLMLQ